MRKQATELHPIKSKGNFRMNKIVYTHIHIWKQIFHNVKGGFSFLVGIE
jgi:hypothetical protein